MTQQPFDPSQYISKVKGRDYLEVKWRIAWMRQEHPNAILETDLMSHDDNRAVMRARVHLPDGGSATGWGSETSTSFENYIEKAETKAIGRALTALGYGTPVGADTDVADTPRQPVQQKQPTGFQATPAQRARIQRLASELQLDDATLNGLVQQHTGSAITQMNKRQASGMIDLLESRRPAAQRAS